MKKKSPLYKTKKKVEKYFFQCQSGRSGTWMDDDHSQIINLIMPILAHYMTSKNGEIMTSPFNEKGGNVYAENQSNKKK